MGFFTGIIRDSRLRIEPRARATTPPSPALSGASEQAALPAQDSPTGLNQLSTAFRSPSIAAQSPNLRPYTDPAESPVTDIEVTYGSPPMKVGKPAVFEGTVPGESLNTPVISETPATHRTQPPTPSMYSDPVPNVEPTQPIPKQSTPAPDVQESDIKPKGTGHDPVTPKDLPVATPDSTRASGVANDTVTVPEPARQDTISITPRPKQYPTLPSSPETGVFPDAAPTSAAAAARTPEPPPEQPLGQLPPAPLPDAIRSTPAALPPSAFATLPPPSPDTTPPTTPQIRIGQVTVVVEGPNQGATRQRPSAPVGPGARQLLRGL